MAHIFPNPHHLTTSPPPRRSAPDEAIDLDVDFEAEVAPGLGRLLGRGGYGEVYEGRWRGQRVAVKLLSMDSEELRQVGASGVPSWRLLPYHMHLAQSVSGPLAMS